MEIIQLILEEFKTNDRLKSIKEVETADNLVTQ